MNTRQEARSLPNRSRTYARSRAARIFAVVVLLLLVTAGGAESSLTVAWDSTHEPGVTGYRVYVGTSPGIYLETYDVDANQTLFVYAQTAAAVRYYFAVASIGAGAVVGPVSEEVSGVASDVTFPAPVPVDPISRPPTDRWAVPRGKQVREEESPKGISSPVSGQLRLGQRVRLASAGAATYVATLLAEGLGSISDLTPTPDGRLLFIEDRQRVRLLTGAGVAPGAALEPGRALTGLALDPAFTETGLLFVGESEPRRDGTDALSIVRYRERRGWFGEGAAVVTGFSVPHAGSAPFALDTAGHLYVAAPTIADGGGGRTDPYEGHLLRFSADGTVPADNRGASPIVALGFTSPTALLWSPGGRNLWLAGSHTRSTPILAQLTAATHGSEGWPRVPVAVAVHAGVSGAAASSITSMTLANAGAARSEVFVVTASAGLFRGLLDLSGLTNLETISVDAFGRPVAVAAAHNGLYVAIRTEASGGAASFAILRLTLVDGESRRSPAR